MNAEELKRGLDDSDAWEQEYECEFVDAANVLLPYSLIDDCVSDEATVECDEEAGRSVRYVGIDIGRKHDLTVCWTLEKVGGQLSGSRGLRQSSKRLLSRWQVQPSLSLALVA